MSGFMFGLWSRPSRAWRGLRWVRVIAGRIAPSRILGNDNPRTGPPAAERMPAAACPPHDAIGGDGAMRRPILFTIGYEKALLRDVVGRLAAAGVAILLDVRDRPISRRPGFSKRQLATAVEEAGIGYVHLAALGTPPEGRLAGRRGDLERFWSIVDEKLARPEAELDLRRAAEIAAAAPACLLCYEADWRNCHRRRIAEILAGRHGFAVNHLAVGAAGVIHDKSPTPSRSPL
jgi:hypothetical protein